MLTTSVSGGMEEVRWPLIRYGVLVVSFCAFLIGVFFIFQGLIQQRALVEKESRISIWFVAQANIEFHRLMESLKAFALQPTKDSADDTQERFEIFWSRLPPMLSGSQTAGLRELEGVVPAVRAMVRTLEEVEADVGRLQALSKEVLESLDDRLDGLRAPLQDLMRHALLYESNEVSGARQRHSELYLQLLSLFVLTLAGGLAVFVMLFIQTVRTHQAVVAAATSAEAAIAARNELELAINSISEGFIIYNPDDTVALFNKRYVELHPSQAEVFAIGVHFRDLLLASVRNGLPIPTDQVESWIEACLRQRREADSTFESELAGGKWLKISERRLSDGRIVGVHTDITELKEREQLINQKLALLQTTLDHMKQGIVVFDGSFSLLLFNDRYIEVNKFPDGFVYPRRKYHDIARFAALRGDFGPGEPDALVASQAGAISQLLRDKKGSFRQQRRLPDGRVVETVVTALPTGGFVKTYEDITERVRSEAERAQLSEKYHAVQKTQALGTLAGGIAHDFNNIIGSILGNTSLLMIDTPKEDPGYERLRQIIESGTRARDLVRQILTYSRNAESERKPLELGAVVKDSLTIVNPLMPSNVSLKFERMDECLVAGDATQIHQVLLNLCLNAAQAIGSKEGQITVSVQSVQARAGEGQDSAFPKSSSARNPVRGQSGTLADGRYARIAVRDTGVGIDEETMPRIFEPFFTTKEVGQGTGLGLAAVQGIVRNHEGVIAIESVLGAGTSFSVYLPLIDVAALPAREEKPSTLPIAGKEKILLVDDDRALLAVTKDILIRLGYSVDAFAEPLLALAAFREKPGDWDLVITDRAMPRVPGEALAKEMKKLQPKLPILMLSGFISAEEDVSLRKAGIDTVISKPVLPDEIGAAVRSIISSARATS
ncbi:MAG: response regulator [Alphaproteobacteria bacterium]|nr:response regulator [Alphaproteobacteria bacterium]